jgi:signal transduction histidine kinase
MTAGLHEIASTLYAALVPETDVTRSGEEARTILEDWLDALGRDAPVARLIDKRTPLTSWLVKQLVVRGIGPMRTALGDEQVFDRELAALVARRESDLAEQALGDRMEAMQRLTAGFAHELRNPVNAARLQLKLLEQRLPDGRGEKTLTAVFDELEGITELLDDFLLFARPSPLEREDREVVALVCGAVVDERPFAIANGIDVRFVTNAINATVPVDGSKLSFVVTELVHNAIEAGLPGGHVDVDLDIGPDRIQLAVRDNGTGISPELRTRIYEPFFSTRDHGRGLGLAIVHAFVALHRGVIELRTHPTETRFSVTIPHRSLD